VLASLKTSPRTAALALALTALLSSAGNGAAGPITFDFNSLGNNANNTAVGNYAQGVVSAAMPGGTVTVSGALAVTNYLADGHVVGPVSNGVVNSVTLHNTDGTFLINDSGHGFNSITFTFSFPVYAVSFDFEIFPDGSGEQPPDFTFQADGTTVFHTVGVAPGTEGTFPNSPFSGPSAAEQSAQLLGSFSTDFGSAGKTTLSFIDWPPEIGIDNLTVDPFVAPNSTPVVPEPAGLLVWALCLGGVTVAVAARRRRSPA
jgi:hypothetical protein